MGAVGKYINGEYVEFASTGVDNIGDIEPNKVIISDGNGAIISSSVTDVEIEALSGVKSNIQTQIDVLAERPEPTPTEFNGAVTTILNEDLPTDKVLISNESGKISASEITKTQLDYLDGLKDNVQNQIDNISVEPQTFDGAVSTVLDDNLEMDKVLISDENGKISNSEITKTELNYLGGLTGNVQEQINYIVENMGTATGVPLSPVTSLEAKGKMGSVEITWADPEDVVFNGETLAEFDGTKVIRNTDHYPSSVEDGALVVDSKVRNQYAETPFTDDNLDNDTDYYYTLFPYTVKNIYTFSDLDKAVARPLGYDPILANNTWEQIAEASELGIASGLWSLGDTKDSCAIIGFNHDDLADGSGKAGITFSCNVASKMFTGHWNSSNNGASYRNSQAYSSLSSVYSHSVANDETSHNKIPEIAPHIKQVLKKVVTGSGNAITLLECHLFLFSLGETGQAGMQEGNPYEGKAYIQGHTNYDSWSRSKVTYNGSAVFYYPKGEGLSVASAGQANMSTTGKLFKYGFCI